MDSLILLPRPRSLRMADGQHAVTSGRRILLQGVEPPVLLFSAHRLQQALRDHAGVQWEITATAEGPLGEIGAVLRVVQGWSGHPQGYDLFIKESQLMIEAGTPTGIFYGVCTLVQVLEQYARQLPCLEINDAPDFAARGVMLDISRNKVPRMETLFMLVDMFAGWKINQVQLYTEHTFAYHNHPDVWAKASPMTGEEIIELDSYCRERFIELVPNQNSFGHMHRWLIHPRYASLAETHDEFDTPWNTRMKGPFSISPVDPESIVLVNSMYDELLPHFTSKQFNVGCDETVDLGQGRSKALCAERGTGRVYLDFVRQIYESVRARGYTMQFWGDIITHYPDLIPELPRDAVALEWGYEAGHPFAETCPKFAASGIPFYVCPGTSSWNTIAGRTGNAIGNLRNAAEHGLRNGAIGYLVTDWGDNGHWQALPISFLGFGVGAAFSWALEANHDMDVVQTISLHAFRDPTGAMGRMAYDLGNVYRHVGREVHNSSVLFWALHDSSWSGEISSKELNELTFDTALDMVDAAMAPMAQARMSRPDAAQITQEFELTARLLRHACHRGMLLQQPDQTGAGGKRRLLFEDIREIIRDYERLWLGRNRPGGLIDSVAQLEAVRASYRVVE